MLQVTDQQLTNLHYLRDVVFPHVREMDRRGRVNLDWFSSRCGTYRCLLGWALSDNFFIRQGAQMRVLDKKTIFLWRGKVSDDVERELFGGASNEMFFRLFDRKCSAGDLDARAARLNKIIAEREAALA